MEILEKIFGEAGRIKIMRLFLFNPERIYDREDIALRTKVPSRLALKEITHLEKMGLIQRETFIKEFEYPDVIEQSNRKTTKIKKKTVGWVLNGMFPYLLPLQNMLINLNTLKHEDIVKKINSVGKIKLIVLAGIFIQSQEGRVDLLVVGDKINKKSLENFVKNIEAEIGKEIRYASFESDDFKYRLSMYDKLVRDILDFPHKKVLNKIAL